MDQALSELVKRWAEIRSIGAGSDSELRIGRGFKREPRPCRAGADPRAITAWELRHGYRLPAGLRAWLLLSNGLYLAGPLIHPISAIGPMIAFARVPDMIVQPESWFELGNPNQQTVCMDLAYRLPGGGCPIFTSGDDLSRSSPRVIARRFDEWFVELLQNGGREYWFDPASADLGDPWQLHRRYAAEPVIPERLRALSDQVASLLCADRDELQIATALGLSRGEVELIFRHLQHTGRHWAGSFGVALPARHGEAH
jgi:hypothetical protein